jgi:dephospho-CoA kinase
MLRVGLTGGIGAGKSTVAAALADLGAVVVDADAISREVVAPGTDGLADIVEAFGDDVLDDDGALDRAALAEIVFNDDDARTRLNGIVHPRVGARTAEIVTDAPDDAILVHDVPLLVENGMGAAFALVVVVDAPVDDRVERLVTARGMPERDARARIAAQADHDARRAAADVWLDNGGPDGEIVELVHRLWDERLVPFEENLREGVAVPEPADVVDPDPGWADQGRRLAARIAVAGGDAVDRVEHVGATAVPGLPAEDVIDLLVLAAGRRADPGPALAAAGYPSVGSGRHGAADPERPVRITVLPASSRQVRRLLGARDDAVHDPEAVRDDPGGTRERVRPSAP